jgi:hypothetical protein
MERKTGVAVWILAAGLATPVSAGDVVKVDGYLSAKRARQLEKEIARNYSDPAKDPPSRAGAR